MNKKSMKILALILTLTMLTGLCPLSVLAEGEEAHEHSPAYLEAVEPTAETDGNIECWYCPGCGKYFADEGLQYELSPEQVFLAAFGNTVEENAADEPAVQEEVTVLGEWNIGKNNDTDVVAKLTSDGVLTITGNGPMRDLTDSRIYWRSDAVRIDNLAIYRYVVTVIIEPGVTTIGDYAFAKCNQVTSVSIPEGVTSIGNFAFQACNKKGLTTIKIPESVTTIGANAFNQCSYCTSFTVPANVTSIGADAFLCSRLTDIFYDGTEEEWSAKGITTLPAGYPNHFATAYDIGKDVETDVSAKLSADGTRLTISGTGEMKNYTAEETPWDNSLGSITSVAIKDGVTGIGEEAFSGCTNLTEVSMPRNLENIGEKAFEGTALQNVNYDGVELRWNTIAVGSSAFPENVNVHFVEDNTCTSLTTLGDIAVNFYMDMDAILTESEKEGATVKVDGIPYALSDLTKDNDGLYPVMSAATKAAPEITDEIKIDVCLSGSTTPVYSKTDSIKDYCTRAAEKGSENLKPLAKAMLDYGSAAQAYFDHNAEALANGGNYSAEVAGVTAAQLSNYTFTFSDETMNKGVSFVANSESSVFIYYNGKLTTLALANGGKGVAAFGQTKSGKMIKVTGIPAAELDNEFTLTVDNSATIKGSALAYANLVLTKSTNAELKTMMQALVLYNSYAKSYFNVG